MRPTISARAASIQARKAPSVASQKTWGNYPAVEHILSAVFEGGLLDFDNASTVESRYFAAAASSQVARNMIGTLWFQLNALKKGASRPAGVPARRTIFRGARTSPGPGRPCSGAT